MKIKNEESFHGTKCILEDGENVLTIVTGCDRDLYWSMDKLSDDIEYDKEFELGMNIPKEKEEVYGVFDRLYGSIIEDMNKSRKDKIEDGDEIVIYSQEVSPIVGNYLLMKKEPELIKLSFNTQLPRPGYDKDLGSSTHIPIRFMYSRNMYSKFEYSYVELIDVIEKEKALEKKKILSRKIDS